MQKGRPKLHAEEKRAERTSLFLTRNEMRTLERLAVDLDQSVQVTVRRIVLLALKRYRDDKAKAEATAQ